MVSAIEIKVEYKTYTVEEIFQALAQNGLEHLRSDWISVENDKVVGGCALGQAAYNLQAPATDETVDEKNDIDIGSYGNLYDELQAFPAKRSKKWFTKAIEDHILDYSDTEDISIAQVIIFWNDKKVYDEANQPVYDTTTKDFVYELKTYDEVVEMAREVMTPYFDKTVKLPHYEY